MAPKPMFPSGRQILVLPAADGRTVVLLRGDWTAPYVDAEMTTVHHFLQEMGCSELPGWHAI